MDATDKKDVRKESLPKLYEKYEDYDRRIVGTQYQLDHPEENESWRELGLRAKWEETIHDMVPIREEFREKIELLGGEVPASQVALLAQKKREESQSAAEASSAQTSATSDPVKEDGVLIDRETVEDETDSTFPAITIQSSEPQEGVGKEPIVQQRCLLSPASAQYLHPFSTSKRAPHSGDTRSLAGQTRANLIRSLAHHKVSGNLMVLVSRWFGSFSVDEDNLPNNVACLRSLRELRAAEVARTEEWRNGKRSSEKEQQKLDVVDGESVAVAEIDLAQMRWSNG
ncbi:hypothetical protein BJ508DRAFT_314152 [Ascobolus immersus RN42]|uniref:Uncharacterized protein n=1 Tax=Ascobolus immersus RN42 TaxID=1160509 RepID=A0A3N4HMH5_ASCIM|nr:hypothetical protein BJ508DRAFT_314152 [Ascobolus immersus RN42]